MSEEYDIADPDDPNTLRVPFMFVPHGCEPTPEWLQAHPGAIKIPAVMVPRDPRRGESGPQWNVQLNFPDEAAATAPVVAAAPPADGAASLPVEPHAPTGRNTFEAYVTGGGDPIAVWRSLKAVFDNPARAAGIVVAVSNTTMTSGAPGPPASADPAPAASGLRGVQYAADVSRNVRTDATPTGASPRPVYIFVGGYRDDNDRNVWYYYIDFDGKHPGQAFYFTRDAPERIKDFIISLPKVTPVNLIGHSYGGDTAAKIAESSTGKINILITVDPVSWKRPDFAVVRSHANQWIDVDATPTDHMQTSNVAAAFGGDWGNLPKDAATMYIETVANHLEFTKMMQTKGPDGRTPEQILLDQ